jgi:hypothetical protein
MPPEKSDFEKEKIERLQRAMYSRSLAPNIHERPRRPLDTEESKVADDFHTKEPEVAKSIVAPRAIGIARTALWWILAGAIFFFICAGGFFAYYFTVGGGSVNASSQNIDISVSGPPQIQSGEKTELQIIVENRNSTTLQLADLVISYPSGTRSPADYTTDLPSQRITLGTIDPGGRRQGTVSAVFAGSQGEHSEVKVELEYHIAGSNAVFVASSEYSVTFASSPLSLSVDSNSETVAGQPVEIALNVQSNANAPVSGVLVSAQYPFGFKITSAEPRPNAAGLWEVGTLVPGQKKTITVRGSLSGEQGDARVFRFTAGTNGSGSSNSITTPLSANAFTMSISKPFLGLAVAINGASGSNVIVSPSDNVVVTIAWQNNLPTAITNAAIVARLTGIQIDGTTVKSPNGFYRSADNIVLWDKSTDRKLENLAPGEKGVASFSFQMPPSDVLKNIQNPYLEISINAAGSRVSESGVPQSLQATVDQKIALASDLQLKAQGLYYTNPFGSVGPMPPKAGVETTYAIVFTVTNTTNKVKNGTVTASLPPYVRWVGIYSPSTEDVTFNQVDGTVTWKLGEVAPGVGLNGAAPRQAAIAIGFTPSTSQIGQKPSLLQNITFSGKDDATGATISRSTADVTSNINGDPGFSAANAEVVK